jgi:hypothetical protein
MFDYSIGDVLRWVFSTVNEDGDSQFGGDGNASKMVSSSSPFCHMVGSKLSTFVYFLASKCGGSSI